MVGWIISKLKLELDSSADMEYLDCISDLINHEMVRSMKNYMQHSDIDCLEHCLYVSYSSYLICRRMNFNYRAATRGGLLHDFFLYDWHVKKSHEGLHGFTHPRIALWNANQYFQLNELEQDIISKHMWPLTITLPKYKEAYIVAAADKYCAFMEIFNFGERENVRRLQSLLCG
ncbi:hypothetical protein SDC9_152019 [bioreactor metagenome]|uniref:HD domain-containing protein n=1 Tax=bioreactor metagenome TaxID=1076179 RepID=A0A645EU75_9ZZZZ